MTTGYYRRYLRKLEYDKHLLGFRKPKFNPYIRKERKLDYYE